MLRAVVVVLLAGLFAASSARTRAASELPLAAFNDNTRSAGTLSNGVLRVSLELTRVRWHPLGKDHAGADVMAFAETGYPAEIPGPMLRVPLGTEIRASVSDSLKR